MRKPDQVNWKGKKVTVLGLAREGTALTRYLVQQGAQVTATDLKDRAALHKALEDLADLAPVCYVLGSHPPEVLDCDVLFVSPGVPLDAPILVEARRRGVTLSSEARLFCRLCPAPILGVTGSSGKTTTVTLAARMLQAGGKRVHLGGNIGSPLLNELAEIQPSDSVVMELSSFQLDFFGAALDAALYGDPAGPAAARDSTSPAQQMAGRSTSPAERMAGRSTSPLFPPGGWSPHIAGVLNVTPNHLDRHPTMDAYVSAKLNILRYQEAQDYAVLGWDDPVTRSFADHCRGQVAFFSLSEPVPQGAYLKGDTLALVRDGTGGEVAVCSRNDLLLRGVHNVANVLAACALVGSLDVPAEAIAEVARTFAGVEHRLELACERQGVSYYNDSIATSPERAIAALNSFVEPIVLLAGGRDKHLPWDAWVAAVQRKVVHVITFGEAAPLIERALGQLDRRRGQAPPIHRAENLEHAVQLAQQLAQPGEVVLFSPGGTSFDAFHDYAERGETFKRLVRGLGNGPGIACASRQSRMVSPAIVSAREHH
jgi:UDP-N-acetylmuramoylalanine--D-glutamate ligase